MYFKSEVTKMKELQAKLISTTNQMAQDSAIPSADLSKQTMKLCKAVCTLYQSDTCRNLYKFLADDVNDKKYTNLNLRRAHASSPDQNLFLNSETFTSFSPQDPESITNLKKDLTSVESTANKLKSADVERVKDINRNVLENIHDNMIPLTSDEKELFGKYT